MARNFDSHEIVRLRKVGRLPKKTVNYFTQIHLMTSNHAVSAPQRLRTSVKISDSPSQHSD